MLFYKRRIRLKSKAITALSFRLEPITGMTVFVQNGIDGVSLSEGALQL
jgi:hypothetical protein